MSRSILRILRGKKAYLGLTAAAFIVVMAISIFFILQPPASIIYDLPKSPGTFNWNTGDYFSYNASLTHEVGDVTTGHFGTLSLECDIGSYNNLGGIDQVFMSVNVSTGVYDNPANSSNAITAFGLWANDTSPADLNAETTTYQIGSYFQIWNCTDRDYCTYQGLIATQNSTGWTWDLGPPVVNFFVPNSGAKQCASSIVLAWSFSSGDSSDIQICAESMFSGSNPGTRDYVYSTVILDISA